MSIIQSFLIVISPLVFYLVFLWWRGKFNKYWYSLYLSAFLWGILAVPVLVLCFLYSVIYFLAFCGFHAAPLALLPVISEELFKSCILIILIKNIKAVLPSEAMIAASITGLAFGTIENLFYFQSNNNFLEWYYLVSSRLFTTPIMHGFTAGVAGLTMYYLRKHSLGNFILFLPIILLVPCTLHYLWNYLAELENYLPSFYAFTAAMIAAFLVVLYMQAKLDETMISQRRRSLNDRILASRDNIDVKTYSEITGEDYEQILTNMSRLLLKAEKSSGKTREKCLTLYNEYEKKLSINAGKPE